MAFIPVDHDPFPGIPAWDSGLRPIDHDPFNDALAAQAQTLPPAGIDWQTLAKQTLDRIKSAPSIIAAGEPPPAEGRFAKFNPAPQAPEDLTFGTPDGLRRLNRVNDNFWAAFGDDPLGISKENQDKLGIDMSKAPAKAQALTKAVDAIVRGGKASFPAAIGFVSGLYEHFTGDDLGANQLEQDLNTYLTGRAGEVPGARPPHVPFAPAADVPAGSVDAFLSRLHGAKTREAIDDFLSWREKNPNAPRGSYKFPDWVAREDQKFGQDWQHAPQPSVSNSPIVPAGGGRAQTPGLEPNGPGGGASRIRGVEEAQRAATEAAGSAPKLVGLPDKPLPVGGEPYVPGPLQVVHEAAHAYMNGAGLPYNPPQTFQKVDPERATRIAQAFEEMEHNPSDPKVLASYNAMIDETLKQYQAIKNTGLKIEFIQPGQDDPYAATPRLATKDMIENKHLWVFPTDLGFGSGDVASADAIKNNPLLRPTDERVGDRQLLANDVFRIVHDYFGHFKDGVGFRADGEENAWRSHSAMYSDLARGAMTSETRGQNSWVNFGPHGETNRTASGVDTTYAPQKIGLLPDWAVNEGRFDPPGAAGLSDHNLPYTHEQINKALEWMARSKFGATDVKVNPHELAAARKDILDYFRYDNHGDYIELAKRMGMPDPAVAQLPVQPNVYHGSSPFDDPNRNTAAMPGASTEIDYPHDLGFSTFEPTRQRFAANSQAPIDPYDRAVLIKQRRDALQSIEGGLGSTLEGVDLPGAGLTERFRPRPPANDSGRRDPSLSPGQASGWTDIQPPAVTESLTAPRNANNNIPSELQGITGKRMRPISAQPKTINGLPYTDLGKIRLRRDIPMAQAIQDYVLHRGRLEGKEFVIAVDGDGSVIAHGRGTENQVAFPKELTAAIRDPNGNVVVHHNHPTNSSFSASDYTLLVNPGLKGLWAHGHGGAVSRAELTAEARAALSGEQHVERLAKRFGLTDPQARAQLAGHSIGEQFFHLSKVANRVYENTADVVLNEINHGRLSLQAGAMIHSQMVARALQDAGIIHYDSNIDPLGIVDAQYGPHIAAAANQAVKDIYGEHGNPGVDRRTSDYSHPGDVGASFAESGTAPRPGSKQGGGNRTRQGNDRPPEGSGVADDGTDALAKRVDTLLDKRAGRTFVSPNVLELSFKDAVLALNTERHRAITAMSHRVDEALGLQSQDRNVIGAWSDGAENSIMTTVTGSDFSNLKLAAAMKGWLANQKGVLAFQPGEGNAALVSFPAKGDLATIHNNLVSDGVTFHTIEPSDGGAVVHVFVGDRNDQGLTGAIEKAAGRYGSEIEVLPGQGEIIENAGGGTDAAQRRDARGVYERLIDRLAKGMEGGVRATWDKLRDHWSPILEDLKLRQENALWDAARERVKEIAAQDALRVSPRYIQSKKAGVSPTDSTNQVDLAAMKASEPLFQHNVALLREYPNITEKQATIESPNVLAERFVDNVKDNLLWLYNKVPDQIRDRSKLWYDGANKIAKKFAETYGHDVQTAAGVIAALSPQKDWFQNVSLAERVMKVYRDNQNDVFDKDMERVMWRIFDKDKYAEVRKAIDGKKLSDIEHLVDMAAWVRVYDQAKHDGWYRTLTPEGEFGQFSMTDMGMKERVAWGSLPEIAKAIAIIETGGDMAEIGALLGERHKVRSFFNNIVSPSSRQGDVTIDTHAVAAGLLRPLSSSSIEAAHNFGNWPGPGEPAAKKSKATGIWGTYPLYAEAYRRAAKVAGVLPRELQSITWEAVRGLFPQVFRSSNRAGQEYVQGLWDGYRSGRLKLDEVRNAIYGYVEGIQPPAWATQPAGPSAGTGGPNEAAGNPGDQGELHRAGVSGPAAGALDSGARAGAAAETAGQGLPQAGGRTRLIPVDHDPFAEWEDQGQPLSRQHLAKSTAPLEKRTEALMGAIDKQIELGKRMKYGLNAYLSNAYSTLNWALRNNNPRVIDEKRFAKEFTYREIMDHLDTIISKTKLTKNMVLFRGVGQTLGNKLSSLPMGAEITDPAFMSTSVSEDIASGFAAGSGVLRQYIIQINAPKGTQALDLGAFFKRNVEQEVLFPRNTSLRLIGKTDRLNRRLMPIYQFEVVQPEAPAPTPSPVRKVRRQRYD